jgi:hypothetical protein
VAFGGCDSRLRILNLADGELVRKVDLGSYIPATVALEDGTVYAASFEGKLFAVNLESGEVEWKYEMGEDVSVFSSPAVGEELVLIGAGDKKLHAVRRADGKKAFTFQAGGEIDSSAVVADARAVFGCDDGRLYVVGLESGKQRWAYRIGQAISAAPAVADGWIVVGCEDGVVYAFAEEPAKK